MGLFSQSAADEEYQEIIRPFLKAVQNNDKEGILSLIRYPLRRQYPVPDINNSAEMNERYNLIFDEILISKLINTAIETDWSPVGWRGIMFDNGVIWIDYEGMIIAINYQSQEESLVRESLINQEKEALHVSLKEYVTPILFCETKNYSIRIDDMGTDSYRLAFWPHGKLQSELPELILFDGERNYLGSGGNHFYIFHAEKYQYVLWVDVLSETDRGSFGAYIDADIRFGYGTDDDYTKNIIMEEEIIYINGE